MVWRRNLRLWENSRNLLLTLSLMCSQETIKLGTRNSLSVMISSQELTQIMCEKTEHNAKVWKTSFNPWDYPSVCTRKTTNCPTAWNPQELSQRAPTAGKTKLYIHALIATEKCIVMGDVKLVPLSFYNRDRNLSAVCLPSLIRWLTSAVNVLARLQASVFMEFLRDPALVPNSLTSYLSLINNKINSRNLPYNALVSYKNKSIATQSHRQQSRLQITTHQNGVLSLISENNIERGKILSTGEKFSHSAYKLSAQPLQIFIK